MNLKDVLKFQFKRVNPFPGLAIDADTWRDAHNYLRDHQRLHNIMFHQAGIIEGLEVTANDPQDLSVNIHPGIAVGPEGNIIVVRNIYHYQIQNRGKETIYLIIQFREVLEGPYQPPDGGQPTRVVDGYRIQERDSLPDEPYLELARIQLNPSDGAIKDAGDRLQPAKNEIDLNFRKISKISAVQVNSENSSSTTPEIIHPKRKIVIGYVVPDNSENGTHKIGLRNLAREIERIYNWNIELIENVTFDNKIDQYTMIYMTGGDNFKLNEEQAAALEVFWNSNGVLMAEDCGERNPKDNGSKKMGPVYDELVSKFKLKLKPVNQNNPLLSNVNVFSQVPCGTEAGMFLEGERIVYTSNDYGCAWQGGCNGEPISREAIRSAFEIGANIIDYAYQVKSSLWGEKRI